MYERYRNKGCYIMVKTILCHIFFFGLQHLMPIFFKWLDFEGKNVKINLENY